MRIAQLFIVLFSFFIFDSVVAASNIDLQQDSKNHLVIENIEVFADAITLGEAKDQAIMAGGKVAIKKLLDRILPYDTKWQSEKVVEQVALNEFIQDAVPVKERMTSHSYQATMNFYFDQGGIRNFMNRHGIHYSEKPIKNALLIPILHQKDGKLIIWTNNEWRDAWNQIPPEVGLMQYQLTKGDLEDVQLLDPIEVMTKPYNHFAKIFKIYKTDSLLAIFVTEMDNKLDISLRFLYKNEDSQRYYSVNKKNNESKEDLYKKTAIELANKIDSEWKGLRVFSTDRTYVTKVKIKIKSQKEWQAIQTNLNKINGMQGVKLIDQGNVKEVEMRYKTTPAILAERLKKIGYSIKSKEGIDYLVENKKE